jgi:solute carrier family 13 (sodium-dependent dicarboxylate transporter), member 2/3/5
MATEERSVNGRSPTADATSRLSQGSAHGPPAAPPPVKDHPESAAQRVIRRIGLVAGPLALLGFAFIPNALHQISGYGHRPAHAAGVATMMAIWWFTEALPVAVTACVPLLLYPLLGVFGKGLTTDLVRSAEPFVDAYIFLFLGGMMIGAAMEQWKLHRRAALHIMRAVGTDPRRLLLGMLIATASISLWISNSATAVLMLPIGIALLAQLEATAGRRLVHYGGALMLAIAYASNVGGIGTKIGTGTNSIFCGFLSEKLHYDISFLRYMALGMPFVAVFIPIIWIILWQSAKKDGIGQGQARDVLDRELSAMGPMSSGEKRVTLVFCTAAVLWIFGDPIRKMIAPHIPELWAGFRFLGKHYEAAVAMLAGLALVLGRALSFSAIKRIPWSTVLLLGGSFAMAVGIEGSGLSQWMALRFQAIGDLPLFWQIAIASFGTVFLSAVASNVATVNVTLNVLPASMPVLSATAIAASCDFMLPAGTPPNAIVFGSGHVRLPVMMKIGFFLDLIATVLVTIYVYGYARHLFE